ncbi:nuclear transport factor 2 family protein [Kutzneria sp. NPDC052558]|uniref:nuclear transport factor 2 family protein n=1 Tax=Kutzneria sp. NPDC052558 TaxID=3364121 RepID=UPI0037CB3575
MSHPSTSATDIDSADPAVDATSATPEVVALVTSLFRDKSSRDPDRFLSNFAQHDLTVGDGTRGAKFATWQELAAAVAPVMPAWPPASRAYATKILGDARSAMVFYTDSPEMFGNEIRLIAPFDFRDGKIIRQVDYWDGRHFGSETTAAIRMPQDQFATEFGEAATGEQSPAALRAVVSALSEAFAAGDAAAAAALFSPDATFEDLTLHAAIVGRQSIKGFLDRSFPLLPYGLGTSVRHTVGSVHGGGYEWVRPDGPVRNGVIAIELQQSRITRFTTIWDGSLVDDATLTDILATTIEH